MVVGVWKELHLKQHRRDRVDPHFVGMAVQLPESGPSPVLEEEWAGCQGPESLLALSQTCCRMWARFFQFLGLNVFMWRLAL